LQGPRQRPLPAALSGYLNKAPGSAGGYLLQSLIRKVGSNPPGTLSCGEPIFPVAALLPGGPSNLAPRRAVGRGHALVADDTGGPACRHTLARRVLSWLRHQQRHRSQKRRPSPAGLRGHSGARPAMLMVSGLGTDAEADWLVCSAALASARCRQRAPRMT